MADIQVFEDSSATQAFITSNGDQFSSQFNIASFSFTHSLYENPLFELDNLAKLSSRLPYTYHSTSQPRIGSGWEASTARDLPQVIMNISSTNALVMLRRVEQDEVFGPMLQRLQSELVSLAGPKLEQDMLIGRATILISSPRRVTAYHMDHDTNFLLQIRGDKEISVFDGSDRSLVTDPELEDYYAGNLNSAAYKEVRQKDALLYPLRPGVGIHVPSHSPHWVQNNDSVSVSVSFNFDLRSLMRLGRVYKVNHFLRRAGFRPTSPGRVGQDGVKLAINACASGLQRARQKIAGRMRHG
jgi:hypothetical protein